MGSPAKKKDRVGSPAGVERTGGLKPCWASAKRRQNTVSQKKTLLTVKVHRFNFSETLQFNHVFLCSPAPRIMQRDESKAPEGRRLYPNQMRLMGAHLPGALQGYRDKYVAGEEESADVRSLALGSRVAAGAATGRTEHGMVLSPSQISKPPSGRSADPSRLCPGVPRTYHAITLSPSQIDNPPLLGWFLFPRS